MKKHVAYALASAMVVSSLGTPILAAYAQEESHTVLIQEGEIQITKEEFLQWYCSWVEETEKEDGTFEKTYILFKEVNRDNYQVILSGKEIYDQLNEDFRKEIDAVLNSVEKEIQPETGEKEYVFKEGYNELYNLAVTVDQEVKAEEEAKKQQETESEQDPETVDEDPESEETKDEADPEKTGSGEQTGESEEEQDNEASSQESETEEIVTPMTLTLSREVLSTEAEQAAPASLLNVTAPVPAVTAAAQSTPETAATVTQTTSALDTDVQNFIDTYLTDARGNLYTEANVYNYRQILAGISDYSTLSRTPSKVNSLNNYLTSNGSRRYTSLVASAQQITNANLTGRSVYTSASTGTGLYGALMTLSAAMMGILFKRQKEKKA